MIANRVNSESEARNLYEKLNMVVTKFLNVNIQYLGCVPQDNNIVKAVMRQQPVSLIYPNAVSTKHFEDIASRIIAGEMDVPVYRRGIRGYLKSVFAKNL